MQDLIDTVLRAGGEAAGEPLALLQEAAISVAVKKALLAKKYTLREGSPRTSEDWLIEEENGALNAKLVKRESTGDEKPDIRVEYPLRAALELKVFGEIGSKASFNRGEIKDDDGNPKNPGSFLWDLQAVKNKTAAAAILVCGARQYDTARGKPWDPRGSSATTSLVDLLPARENLQCEIQSFSGTWRSVRWDVRGCIVAAPEIQEFALDGTPQRKAEARVVMALRLTPD